MLRPLPLTDDDALAPHCNGVMHSDDVYNDYTGPENPPVGRLFINIRRDMGLVYDV